MLTSYHVAIENYVEIICDQMATTIKRIKINFYYKTEKKTLGTFEENISKNCYFRGLNLEIFILITNKSARINKLKFL